eukprot:TRINITY_DN11019_c0_g1_i2.p1 TRINITY_DN11019_c0_g1~~TRINITY_DN11019_c0_g1_i2.p1  ORF type:complete len:525 (-),score=108.74 TRINITY_DN11019_c0_g1_i2:108-1502(-)
MGGLLSIISAVSNLATAGAMVYLALKLTSKASARPQPSETTPGSPAPQTRRIKRKGSDDFADNFARQTSVEPRPELGHQVVEFRDEAKKRSAVSFPNQDGTHFVILDSPEALLAMKNVFKRLCTNSNELLTVDDIVKVHNLLGEPVDDEERARMTKFFGTESTTKPSISFQRFVDWWSDLHDSSADPDSYYSQERYRQRFKVLQSRLKDPKIANVAAVSEGDPTSRRYRVFFENGGDRLSPWHDIPLKNSDGSYNFICEIPKWTRKKYEIATGEAMNPIKQDVKNGVLREYKWGDMLFNYGAFPQTWEDPKHISEETGCPGDNDPIDVIELGTRQRPVGAITRVKIIGVIAMIDDNETDWKVLTLAMDDDRSPNVHDLNDLDAHMPGVTQALTHWLRMYKTAEGKSENRFGCNGKPQGAAFATRIVEETHAAWRQLMAEANSSGKMKKVASGAGELFTELALDD